MQKKTKYQEHLFLVLIVFFPYKNPQVLVFVMLDEPEVPYHWGAEGAAVAFRRIATRIINMDDSIIPPNSKSIASAEIKITEKNEFAKSLQKLVPSISVDDLEKGNSGVRAQAMIDDGSLIQDFSFTESKDSLHVVNAPSPAATASLAIGELIAKKYFDKIKN